MRQQWWQAAALAIGGAGVFFAWDSWKMRRVQAQAAREPVQAPAQLPAGSEARIVVQPPPTSQYRLAIPEDLRAYYERIGPLPEGFDELAPPPVTLEESDLYQRLQGDVQGGWIPGELTLDAGQRVPGFTI